MKIAVTGATGHVGLNLVEQLVSDGHQVRAFASSGLELLDHQPVERIQGDVRDEASLLDCFRDVDWVFHLAAVISIDGDQGGLVSDVNVRGARTSAQAALQAGVARFVHFSSIHAFDIHAATGMIDESSARVIGSHSAAYDRSKALGEAAVREVIGRGLDGVIIHPTGVLGATDLAPSRAGRGLMDAARGRLPVIVDGSFDWVDVHDVVNGACAAAERGIRGRSYILSGGRRSILELASRAAHQVNAQQPLVTLPLWLIQSFASLPTLIGRLQGREPWFTAESIATLGTSGLFSNQLAQDELGFRPRDPEQSVEALIKWFLSTGALKGSFNDPTGRLDSASTAFVRQLSVHPVNAPSVRGVMARALAEIAIADDVVDDAERVLLQQFGGTNDAESLSVKKLATAEIDPLSAGTRESILLVAITMACVDEDYTWVEREAVNRLRERLAISRERAVAIDHWAREFVVDQRMDAFYADGVVDDDERVHIQELGRGLGVSLESMKRLEANARRRRGIDA
jgi:dihydroflavonol-4-reductase